MNKRFSYLIVALMLLLGGGSIWAQTEFTIGDLTYYHDGGYGNIVQVSAANTSISGEITIPAEVEYDDQTWYVELVKERGFKNCQNVTSVVINANLREICVEAFEKCYNLQSIKLPSTLTHIRFGAFYDCTSLKSLTIPSSVWIIERAAFHNTTALKNVVIEDAESGIQFWNGNENYNYGDANIFNSQLDKIYIGRSFWTETSGNIATSAKEIETAGSFGDIPTDFTKDNLYLTKVTLGGNIYSIGDKAFYHCENLADVTITADVRYIGTDAFCGTSITNIDLPETMETIGYGAFYNCKKLESITIPSSVWAIYRAAFYGTDALKNVVIEDGENPINFYNDNYEYNWGNANLFDSEIEKIYIGRNIGFTVSSGKLAINAEEVEFGGNFGDVPAQLFKNGGANNYRLKKVTIGGVGTSIGDEAFFHCSNLAEINITAPIERIGIDAFCRANKLTSITFPETVTSLNHGVVQNCEMLEYVFIPKSVTEMGRSVFLGCPLREVVIEDGTETLYIHNSQYYDGYTYGDNNIFSSDVLQKIHVGRNISMGAEGSFVTHADEIELGVNVTSITGLFSNTTGTTKVTAPWTEPFEIAEGDFSSAVKANALLLVPRVTADAYTEAGWDFANIGYPQYEVMYFASVGGKVKIGDLAAVYRDSKTYYADRETDVVVEVEPDQDYDFDYLSINFGDPVAVVDGKYTIENIVEDKWVNGYFKEKPKFEISATAGIGGTVNVQGGEYGASENALVYRDRDAVVGIQCNDNYEIVSVVLDENDVTDQLDNDELTIANIQGAHQVNVTFQKINLNVNLVATVGGSLRVGETTATNGHNQTVVIARGQNVQMTATPDEDYDFTGIKNGENLVFSGKRTGDTYTHENLQDEPTFTATFSIKPLVTIAASATNGTATPSEQQVRRDRNATVTLTPNAGHYLSALTVNGNNALGQQNGNTLTLSNIQEDQNVVATFTKYVYNVTATPATNGTINIANASVEWGGSTTATLVPASGYMVETVTINGGENLLNTAAFNKETGVLTISNVTANTTVTATFRILSYTVTINDVDVTASTMYPQHGQSVTFTIANNPDRELTSFMVNGSERIGSKVGNTITVSATSDLNVVATFRSTVETITVNANGVGTYCCDTNLDFTGNELKAYIAIGFNKNTGTLLLSREYDIPAGTPIYLKAAQGTYKVRYSDYSYNYYVNMLKRGNGTLPATEGIYTNFFMKNGAFTKSDGTANVGTKRAYLQIPTSFLDPSAGAKINIEYDDEMIDGIEDYIMFDQRGNDRIYNLNGQQVNKAGRGVYIVNGKKVINK